ncbi:MAG TPA: TonB-dependent receptor, partial [Ignavibacteriales bacterium]|nr:TonB-dependent receptor [Ignavibacteriales bacterium]
SVNFKLKEAESGLHYDLSAVGGYNNLKSKSNDYKLSANVNTRFFEDRLGVLVQGDFERRNRSSNEQLAGYQLKGAVIGQYNPLYITNLSLSSINRDKRRGGGLLVMDYKLPNGKLLTTNLYSRTVTDALNRTEIYEVLANDKLYNFTASKNNVDVLTNKLEYDGDFDLLHVNARVSHAFSESDEPESYFVNFIQFRGFNSSIDQRVHPKDLPPQYAMDLSQTYLNDLRKFKNNSKERELTGNLDLSYPVSFSTDVMAKFKVGGKYRYKDRSYKHNEAGGNAYYSGKAVNDAIVRAYPYMSPYYLGNVLPIGVFWDENADVGSIFGDEYNMNGKTYANLLRDAANIAEKNGILESWSANVASNAKFNYSGNEYAAAGYFMADVNIGKSLQLIPGFRYEYLYTAYTAPHGNSAYSATYPHTDTTANVKNGYFLPIVHLRYKPLDWFDVRFAYTNTLSYPDYSAIIPFIDIQQGNRVAWNNPNLKAARSHNYDVYASFYENTLGLLTVGGFYKEISDLIIPWYDRKVMNPADFPGLPSSTRNYKLDMYLNNPNKATIKGIEVDWQTRFWYLPGILSGFVLNANYTHITSETKYPLTRFEHVIIDDEIVETIIDTFYTNRMLEQPDDIINLSLGYDFKGFSINVSMIYQANIFKTNNFWQEQWGITDDYTRFDIAVKQDLPYLGIQLFGNINNINGAKDVTLMNGNSYPNAEQEYDMTMDLGFRMRL